MVVGSTMEVETGVVDRFEDYEWVHVSVSRQYSVLGDGFYWRVVVDGDILHETPAVNSLNDVSVARVKSHGISFFDFNNRFDCREKNVLSAFCSACIYYYL